MKINFLHDVSGFIAGEADVHPDVAARHVREGTAVNVEEAKEEKAPENPALSSSENTGTGEGVQTEGDNNPEGAKAPEEITTNPENV